MNKIHTEISIAIIAHNADKRIKIPINSLIKNGVSQENILVIDVASTDDTVNYITSNWPEVKIKCLPENGGPNIARNTAIKLSDKPYVLLIDDDVELEKGCIEKIFRTIKSGEKIAVVTPTVVYKNLENIIQYSDTHLHFLCEAINENQDKDYQSLEKNEIQIGTASGCCLLIRREYAIHVGMFDENLFFGKTDGEFTHRIKIAGYEIIENQFTKVFHHKRSRGTIQYYHQIKNRWYFILKNYQLKTIILLLPVLLIHEFFEILLLILLNQIKVYFRAVINILGNISSIMNERAKVNKLRKLEDKKLLASDKFVLPKKIQSKYIFNILTNFYCSTLNTYWAIVKLF